MSPQAVSQGGESPTRQHGGSGKPVSGLDSSLKHKTVAILFLRRFFFLQKDVIPE